MASINVTTNLTTEPSFQHNVSSYDDCNLLEFSFPVKIAAILCLSFILLSSLVGNTLIIIVVYKRPEMRKTINYFIVNMAVSDFLLPFTSIPVRIAEIVTTSPQWHIDGTAGLIFCKLNVFLDRVSFAVSVQSLCWIALDRFVAVVFPMKLRLISPRFRALAIASTWIVAMTMRSLDLYSLELVEIGDGRLCTSTLDTTDKFLSNGWYMRVYAALFVVVPFILMTILYCIIALTLQRQNKAIPCTEVHQRSSRKKEGVRMSFCIITAFYFCNLPLFSTYLFMGYKVALPSCLSYKIYWIVGNLIYCLSSTINPIICMTFVSSYRRGLREILSSCWSERLPANNPRSGVKSSEQISLQGLREISKTRDNLAFSET